MHNVTINVEETLSRNKIIWLPVYSKIAALTDIEKMRFFSKRNRKRIFGKVIKTSFYVSRGTFWRKIYIFKNYLFIVIFGLWAKNFGTSGPWIFFILAFGSVSWRRFVWFLARLEEMLDHYWTGKARFWTQDLWFFGRLNIDYCRNLG